jgi:DNA-binding transcriptional ArsR family regulator
MMDSRLTRCAPDHEDADAMDLPGGPCVADPATAAAHRDVITACLDHIAVTDGRWEAGLSPIAMTVVDAMLHADAAALEEVVEPLRLAIGDLATAEDFGPEVRGYLLGLLSATRWALDRLPDPTELQLVADSLTGRMLTELVERGALSSQELRERLDTGHSQLSRVGNTLRAAGLVSQRRAGRQAIWETTPRGRQALVEQRERRSHQVR